VEILRFGQRVNFDGGLGTGTQDSLSTFALGSQSSHGSLVVSDVNALLFQEVGRAELDQFIVKIFSSQMGVTGSSLHLEDTIFNGQQGHIEGSSSQIEDKHVSLSLSFLIKTVGNGGSGGFVDDTEDVQAGDSAGVFSGLSLGIVEIGGDGDHGVFDGLGEVSFGGFFHLHQHHSRDFFSVEGLVFSFVFDNDFRLSVSGVAFDFERP